MNLQQQLYLGIDGGGTKCKARLEDAQGQLLGEGLSGPANPVRDLQQTYASIIEATTLALQQAKLAPETIHQLVAGVGLAGVNLPSYRKQVENWQHPFKKMTLTTDLHIACLGAHHGQDGAVIITGTGFCAGSVRQNQYLEIGGHGFVLGDSGSGARLGASAIRRLLEVLDGIAPQSQLVDDILTKLGCTDALSVVEKTLNAKPAFFAQFAPLVMQHAQQHEPLAEEVVRAVAHYISRVARRLLADHPARISMIGGIAVPIKQWLDEDVRQQLSDPLLAPEVGAIFLVRPQHPL